MVPTALPRAQDCLAGRVSCLSQDLGQHRLCTGRQAKAGQPIDKRHPILLGPRHGLYDVGVLIEQSHELSGRYILRGPAREHGIERRPHLAVDNVMVVGECGPAVTQHA